MKVQVINTGRPYTLHGQVIGCTIVGTHALFADISRGISGVIKQEIPGPTMSDLPHFVLAHYDKDNYVLGVFAPGWDIPQETMKKLEDETRNQLKASI